nr:NAC domain-containing protein [Tanacetum cinerariifolium]
MLWGPQNDGNYPGCSSVGSKNEFVYDPNPYSYNETPNFFNQPSQYQYETYSCEIVEGTRTWSLFVNQGTHSSMIRVLVTIKILVLTNLHIILRVSYNSATVVRSVEAVWNRLLSLRNSSQDPSVDLYYLEGSDEGIIEIDSLTKEPLDTLLMGDEVISIIPAREINEFIKSCVGDLVLIPRESELTLDSNFECDMPTPLPTTDVRKEDFDINSPLGEQVINFLMENVDVVGFPRHLVKRLISHLVKNLSLTKRMSNEPLGDDSKLSSYGVTFSNSLFDFNDDYTLCYNNLIFDEEFEDISSLDPPKSTPLNYEPLGNPDSVTRSLETSDLNLKELINEIGLDCNTPKLGRGGILGPGRVTS